MLLNNITTMIYTKCPTCKHMLSHIVVDYEKKMDEIEGDQNMSQQEKNKKKQDLINSYNFRRYCCKMRVMTYERLVTFIK